MIFTTRRLPTLLLLTAFCLSACTEKRPQIFSQGQGTNLDTVAQWSSKFVDVQTGKTIGTAPTTNAQEKVKISENVKAMNHFDLVKLVIADEQIKSLVGSPPFRARPNTSGVYQLQIKLTDNYLKILKVAKAEDLPFEEHFYTEEKLADGRIAIPLVGYKIKGFYRIEAQKTSDDRESHQLIEIVEDDTKKATHVRIDWAAREVFEAVKKVDLFPAELFFEYNAETKKFKPYEWYHAETVTEKSLTDSNTIVGESANRVENSKLNPATKVVFLPREGELRVVNVARDERLSRDQIQSGADLNSEATMLLPVQWRDYRTQAAGVDLSMKGEKVEEVQWSERKFFEVNFTGIESAAILNGGRAGPQNVVGTNRLIDIEIDTNYFSFTILNMIGSNGRKIHYSFLRADRDRLPYAPKRSFKEDRNTFGFFMTTKPFYPNWEYYTENDFNKRLFTSRMNPAQKEITFHLSKDSPKELEAVTAKSIEAWDRAFQSALKGTGREIRIKLSPVRAQLGDLRYNVIHLVDTLNEDGLLGFGPSVADPETGEIVASTTNVYVNSFQAISANTVRQYILNRLEKRLTFDDKPQTLVADPAGISKTDIHFKSRAGLALARQMEFQGLNLKSEDPKWNQLLSFGDQTEKKLRDEALSNRCQFASAIVSNTSDREIKKHCPGIEKVVQAHLNDSFLSSPGTNELWEQVWEESREAIRECSKKLVEEKLVSTLIHEVGHNFGLRHNFYGSYDKANFRSLTNAAGEEITPQSSSIMEYTVWEEDRLTEAGPYDVAAIKFGYGDHVELVGGAQVALPLDKSIADALKAKSEKKTALKPYLFCTDEEAYLSFNALCRPQDFGTSPKQIVAYYIELFDRLQEIRKYRRVRPSISSPEYYANDNAGRIFVPLKEIYDQWRYQLGEYVRKSNRYLSSYSEADYKAILAAMKEDTTYKPIYAQYYEASQMIYQFFKRVAFSSNQYCIIEDSSGRRPIEFDRLRDELAEATRGAVRIRSCAEAAKATELAQVLGEPTVTVVAESGSPVNSYRYDQATTVLESVTDDVVGNSPTRMLAGMLLSFRYPNVRNQISRYMPSIMDEPNYLAQLKSEMVDRITKGVKFDKNSGIEGVKPVFEQETTLFSNFVANFRTGLFVPNTNMDAYDLNATRARLKDYFVYRPIQGENPQGVTAVLAIDGRVAFVSQGADYTDKLINAYNATEKKLSLIALSASYLAQVEPFLKKQIPATAATATMKVKDLVGLYQAIQGFRSKSGDFYSCVARTSPALVQLDAIFAMLVADYGKLTSEAEATVFAEKPVLDYVKAGLKQEFKATQENLGELTTAIKVCSEKQNLVVRDVNKYRKDLTSQKTLIYNALSAFAPQ